MIDVQGVALDPLAAVEQPPQRRQLAVDPTPQASSIARHGAHLVGDRADAADARGDVGRLGEAAAAQERLEEARRLEDVQLDVVDLAVADPDVQRALALDAGEGRRPSMRAWLVRPRCSSALALAAERLGCRR